MIHDSFLYFSTNITMIKDETINQTSCIKTITKENIKLKIIHLLNYPILKGPPEIWSMLVVLATHFYFFWNATLEKRTYVTRHNVWLLYGLDLQSVVPFYASVLNQLVFGNISHSHNTVQHSNEYLVILVIAITQYKIVVSIW